ncbi:MAG TPA: histidine phosphatase family protein [Candidatus Baltobacteraceae bacterium]|jgi:probable phosphoglycerate mutase|nr:histidine phosphatase family protein [Candidatus Baltobacteraceae bacterium]
MRLYVARHGETDWNYEGRYQGQRESTLTELGRRQAEALSEALSKSGARRVIASPLRRCVDTARPLAARLGVRVETDDRLLEIAHGSWEGRLRDEIERADADRMHAWREAPHTVTFPGGESLTAVDRRWREFADSVAEERDDVVVVTHDVLVRLAILAATGGRTAGLWQPRVRNGGYAMFEKTDSAWKLLDECREDYLEGLLADTSRQAL